MHAHYEGLTEHVPVLLLMLYPCIPDWHSFEQQSIHTVLTMVFTRLIWLVRPRAYSKSCVPSCAMLLPLFD